MVFFNYATMQMAAKVVYYGPGLCGKTTNLHHIYGRTAPGSRGEMVSLETETDRTLFFDLLPLDVGVIGGFKTRVQLYTVPGQVFYNTTRKLVLKGVDGIVFVADSQRAMKDANVESLANLKTNLAEIGVKLDEIPLVLQYNKRDLANILSLAELEDSLNPEKLFESYEACAVLGQGVFETLKAISRLTLRSLKKRMLGEEKAPAPRVGCRGQARGPCVAAAPSKSAPKAAAKPAAPPPPPPPADDLQDALDVDPGTFADKARASGARLRAQPAAVDVRRLGPGDGPGVRAGPGLARCAAARSPARRGRRSGSTGGRRDQRRLLRRGGAAGARESDYRRGPARQSPLQHRHPRGARTSPEDVDLDRAGAREAAPSRHRHFGRRSAGVEPQSPQGNQQSLRGPGARAVSSRQGHQVTVGLRFEDQQGKEVGEGQSFSIELQSRSDIERLLLSLKFHILGK